MFLMPRVEVAAEYNIQSTTRFLREELTRLDVQLVGTPGTRQSWVQETATALQLHSGVC